MAQSIRRGDEWWNQRPDGVWLKWSSQTQKWEPQQSGPPPPSTPDNPFSTTPSGELPSTQWGTGSAAGRPASPGAGQAPANKNPKKPPSVGRQALIESLSDPTSAPRANSPTFSETRRSLPSVRENKILLAIVAGLLIIGAFAGTYFGATMLFGGDSSVAQADVPIKTPKGYSEAKWAYILKMDSYCQGMELTEYMQDFAERASAIESEEEMLAMLDELEAKVREIIAEFREGPLPKQDLPLLHQIFALHDEMASFFDRLRGAAQTQDAAAIQTLMADATGNGMLEVKLMGRYGFQVCGNPGV